MTERIASGFHPFVIPFLLGMAFVLSWCLVAALRVIFQLSREDRLRFFRSFLNPKILLRDIRDILLDCLLHVKLWKRNPLLGYMHSSIAFGWFMLIVLGHLEVMFFLPDRLSTPYYPIFFNYFVAEGEQTIGGKLFLFLMDFFLLVVLSGIVLAMVKRVHSRFFGMRRTTRLSLTDRIGLYSLWAIFPLRLLAEGFTAHISGGSFLTIPLNWVARAFLGNELNMLPTWWAYSIALCIFMCVLPFSRYMHIPAEMLLIPMRNAGLKVRYARKGLAKVMVYSCPGCGVCIDACPMSVKKANTRDTTVYLNRQIRRGNEKRIEEISDKCLLCGKCSTVCQIGIDAPMIRIAQRSHRKYGLDQDYSDLSLDRIPKPEPGGKVLYFAGCMTQLTPRISKSMESIFRKAGIDYRFLDKDGGLCCGRPLMTAGRIEQAKQLIAKNTELILSSGCDTLVLSCPICWKIFRERYDLGGMRVVHHSVYLEELIENGLIRPSRVVETVAYHDPCELGRGTGIYEEPRRLISNVATLVEAGSHHDQSICCGGSIGSLTLGFSQREELTRNALKNLTVASPRSIATACPLCLATFSRYSDRPVQDLAELVDRSLE